MSEVTPEVLAKLREITTPTICNVLQALKARDPAQGFVQPGIRTCTLWLQARQ